MAAKTGQGNSPTRSIRGPSNDIWEAAAQRATELGVTRNAAIVRLITEYANGRGVGAMSVRGESGMVELDMARLREVAEAATQADWWAIRAGKGEHEGDWVVDSEPTFIVSTHYDDDRSRNDAEHIATFDPPTVLALLDRLDAAEAALGKVRALIPSLPILDDGMVHHGDFRHSGAFQCDLCPDYPHATCIASRDLRAALASTQREEA